MRWLDRMSAGRVHMKVELHLVTLQMGPLEFVLADNEPRPDEHEVFTRPL